MELKSCKKIYQKETHRSKTLETTYEDIKDLTDIAGITRVADITKLDRIGIPVFSCIRPAAADGAVSVYNGKGATPLAARVSAIMEGIERFSGEIGERKLLAAAYSDLDENKCISPGDLILTPGARYDKKISWTSGYRLNMKTMDTEDILIPADAVFHPMPAEYDRLVKTNTNGLASGNSIEEALFHGLCEVIERDAWSLVEASGFAGPVIENIDDEDINYLWDMFKKKGVDVILRDITSDVGLPTIAAVADDLLLKDPTLLCTGMGTHSSKKIAALRALTEVAQSRATQIHGAREDTTTGDMRKRIGYDRMKRLNSRWFDKSDRINFKDIKECSKDDFLDEIKQVGQRLSSVGLNEIVFADLTHEKLGIPVVRAIVPGAECYSVDHERKGKRFKDALKMKKMR